MNESVSPMMIIAVEEAKIAASDYNTTLGMLRAAMRSTCNSWCIVDENERFRAAMAAVLLLCGLEDKQVLIDEWKLIKSVTALFDGIPVDLEAVCAAAPEHPFGIMRIWNEIKEENSENPL
jgi:hypothetical protein